MYMAGATQSQLVYRRLENGERDPVLEVFDGLSERSRALRFHGGKPRLTEADLESLADVGSCGREAVVAVEPDTGRVVGIARYVVDVDDASAAEVAYAVVDDWQGRGVGRRLIVELGRRADACGIARLRGLVVSGNTAAVSLLTHIGNVESRAYDGGALEVEVAIRA
jgi:GNAT superfamily N-acetyltransferase